MRDVQETLGVEKENVQFPANAGWIWEPRFGITGREPAGERRRRRRKAELLWNSTTICWQQLQLQQRNQPLSSSLGSFPGTAIPSCHNSLLELLILFPISPWLGLSSRSCTSCKSLKRAAEPLGVFLGMIIPVGISPDPKSLIPNN